MELGFSIRHAGPLSQIGFHVISLDTALHLATGLYGWWKARERATSLIELLAVDAGKLISTSSFNLNQYAESRTMGLMHGLVSQNGTLHEVPLPKASTAVRMIQVKRVSELLPLDFYASTALSP